MMLSVVPVFGTILINKLVSHWHIVYKRSFQGWKGWAQMDMGVSAYIATCVGTLKQTQRRLTL